MSRPKKYKPTLTFVQDSRERNAFRFGALLRNDMFQGGDTVVRAIVQGFTCLSEKPQRDDDSTRAGHGDYTVAVDDLVLPIRLERKELGDFYGVCGYSRDRFERELEQLRQFDYRGLIIEASLDKVMAGYERSRISGRAATASAIAWGVRYGLFVWFGETHRRSAGLCQRILEQFATDWWERQLANPAKTE